MVPDAACSSRVAFLENMLLDNTLGSIIEDKFLVLWQRQCLRKNVFGASFKQNSISAKIHRT